VNECLLTRDKADLRKNRHKDLKFYRKKQEEQKKKTHQVKDEVIDSKLDGGMLNLSIKNDNNKSIVPNFWAGYKSSTNYQKQKTKIQ